MVWSQAGDVVRPPPECRLHKFDLARARVLLASDQRDASRAQLDKILREAHARGFVGIEFEARLALAELDKASGRGAVARTELAVLQNGARSKGFGLVARKAATTR
jgi:hypothetical protein